MNIDQSRITNNLRLGLYFVSCAQAGVGVSLSLMYLVKGVFSFFLEMKKSEDLKQLKVNQIEESINLKDGISEEEEKNAGNSVFKNDKEQQKIEDHLKKIRKEKSRCFRIVKFAFVGSLFPVGVLIGSRCVPIKTSSLTF
jgi:hypothetical protein